MYFYCCRRERLEINVLQTGFYFGFRAKMSMGIQLSLCHVLSVQCVFYFWFLPFLLWCSTFCHHLCPLPVLFWRFPLSDTVTFCTSCPYAWPPSFFKIYLIRLTWCRQSFLLTGLCPDLLHLWSPVSLPPSSRVVEHPTFPFHRLSLCSVWAYQRSPLFSESVRSFSLFAWNKNML